MKRFVTISGRQWGFDVWKAHDIYEECVVEPIFSSKSACDKYVKFLNEYGQSTNDATYKGFKKFIAQHRIHITGYEMTYGENNGTIDPLFARLFTMYEKYCEGADVREVISDALDTDRSKEANARLVYNALKEKEMI